jgi:hypothetical protein
MRGYRHVKLPDLFQDSERFVEFFFVEERMEVIDERIWFVQGRRAGV